jgi:zeaxanthin glucosyltransferase
MRLGMFCPAVPGHLNPMTALGRQLQKRGHEVVFFSSFMSEPFVRAAGLELFPFAPQFFRREEVAQQFAHLSGLQGPAALQYVFQMIAWASREIIEDGPRLIRESKVDALVLDSLWRNLDLVAMHLEVPYVQVACALFTDYTGRTPFFVYDWPYETGPAAEARNVQGIADFAPVAAPCEAVTREYVERVGLPIDLSDPYGAFSRLAQITQTPREFDFPGGAWPLPFHYTGPLHDGEGRIPIDFPWERLTGEPLVYASMGTLNNGSHWVYQTILDGACAEGRQLVLSVGQNVDPAQWGPVPANTIIVARAPQVQVLRKAALCITHGGLNTVLEALTQGVPLVVIPVANDQPGVAARVAYTKTGRFVPLKELTAAGLRTLVDEVMTESVYRENAGRLQAAIRETNGLAWAADLVERAFGV